MIAKLNQLKYELLELSSNSPDFAPSGYYLFLKLKKFMAGKCFTSNDEVIATIDRYFTDLLK